jgi:hypothetical protein
LRTLTNTEGELTGRVNNDGGYMVRLLNKTGAASVRGSIVRAGVATPGAFSLVLADNINPVGVVYEAGVLDGSLCWVVTSGRAQVLIENTTAASLGNWIKVSDNANGRADASNALPLGGTITALEDHLSECGHSLEAVTAGTNKLVWAIVHFN